MLKQLLSQSGKTTLFITALCALIYAGQMLGFEWEIMDALHYPADVVQETDVWRYFTHSLVHLSNLHILFNLSWFWIFGGMIEQKRGAGILIVLYFVAAIISGYVQNAVSGPAFFGLSGVVYAVMGYVFVMDKFNHHLFELPEGFFSMLIIGIVLGFVSPFFGVEMGNAAHISGLITGCVIGFFDSKLRKNSLE